MISASDFAIPKCDDYAARYGHEINMASGEYTKQNMRIREIRHEPSFQKTAVKEFIVARNDKYHWQVNGSIDLPRRLSKFAVYSAMNV